MTETTPKGNVSASWELTPGDNDTLTGWMYVFSKDVSYKVVLRPVKK